MKILVACEESQAVTIELRKLGHEAYSCDLQECSGGYPGWHFKSDVFRIINGGVFATQKGDVIGVKKWDMMIAHPTCTYLTNSGVRWLYEKSGEPNIERWINLNKGSAFFKKLLDAPIDKIAIENPIPHKYAVSRIGRKYDQLIQPFHFGHMERKATCFWLKNLPKLIHTDNVFEEMKKLPKNEQQRIFYLPPGHERTKLRSKTFSGIARAMAEQWGCK